MDISNLLRQFQQNPLYQSLAIAVIALMVLAVTQISYLQTQSPMSELFVGEISQAEWERIQIAFDREGLSNFLSLEGRVQVPKNRRSEYLNAITKHDALPARLKNKSDEHDTAMGILMTRSQQQIIAKRNKKNRIREMVMRLPFVEQAWFEMDTAQSHNAFASADQTAVISIEPVGDTTLDAAQIDTITRIIRGMVAGIEVEQIQIIDVHSGYAHRAPQEFATDLTATDSAPIADANRIRGLPALEQQNYYENRIRRGLADFAGVDIAVTVDIIEIPAAQMTPISYYTSPAADTEEIAQPLASAGANGFASIYQQPGGQLKKIQSTTAVPVQSVSHRNRPTAPPATEPTYESRVSVNVTVPQSLVEQRFQKKFGNQEARRSGLQSAFEEMEIDIVQRIQSLIPASSFSSKNFDPIQVQLRRSPQIARTDWQAVLQQFGLKYWPSIAIVSVGLLLITIVTRNGRNNNAGALEGMPESIHADILSMKSAQGDTPQNNSPAPSPEAESQLNQLLQRSPEGTRQMLETWLKDAA